MLGLQYSSTPQRHRSCVILLMPMKAKAYQFHVVLSSPPTLLMVSDAYSLAPCVDPLLQINSKF